MSASAELWPYLLLIVVGFLPNEVWRVLGLLIGRGLSEDSELVLLARAVATALVAAVAAKLIVFATGALAFVPFEIRLGAVAGGFVAFLIARRSVFIGVAVGEALLLIGGALIGR
jgi:hypothetical protein